MAEMAGKVVLVTGGSSGIGHVTGNSLIVDGGMTPWAR
jgi:NADP-dependent 3-hydroxy acid dehydrogenase YdfG